MADDIGYWLERSEVEAIRQIEAVHPAAAAAHGELCLLYTARVLAAMLTRRSP